MAKAPRIPLVGSYTNRNTNPSGFLTKDQQFINCFPTVVENQITGKKDLKLNKRNGFTASSALSGVAEGLFGQCVWTGHSNIKSPVMLAYGNTGSTSMSFWDAVTSTKIGGDISTVYACYGVSETLISGTSNLVAILGDSSTSALEAWFLAEGGAWTQITDADFPANLGTPEVIVGNAAHLGGYMFVMTRKGNVWNSDLNSLSSWSANNFIAAQIMPDTGVGLAKYGDTIAAFGKFSIEFFRNNGNPSGSPLVRIESATVRMGALPYSYPDVDSGGTSTIFPFGDTVYFLGIAPESGAIGMYRLNGGKPDKVSNEAIDILLAAGNLLGIVGSMTLFGMTHIVMRTTGLSGLGIPCFCVELNFWWIVKFANGETPLAVAGGSPINNSTQFNAFNALSSAKIFKITSGSAIYQDDGSAYTMTVQTENIDFGTDAVKFMPRLRIIGDTQSSTSNLAVSYSDDDFANFTSAGNIDLSSADKSIGPLGQFRRRSIKLTHAANTPCRLEAMEFQDLFVGTT